ncbi:toll-like receptor 13 [Littorina saxatilis]|uniref:toll-like receptor 13 n=1 Tax=Littorina saxatilis TaxID=31220 RepID=UPI0038B46D02
MTAKSTPMTYAVFMQLVKCICFATSFVTVSAYLVQQHDNEHPPLESIQNSLTYPDTSSQIVSGTSPLFDSVSRRHDRSATLRSVLTRDDSKPYNPSQQRHKPLKPDMLTDWNDENLFVPGTMGRASSAAGKAVSQKDHDELVSRDRLPPQENIEFRIPDEPMWQRETGVPVKTATYSFTEDPVKPTADYTRRGYPCIEEKCICSGVTANCSHNNGTLTVVPKLPPKIEYLIFSFNNLTTIDVDTFKNVPELTHIDLRYNGLKQIGRRTFDSLTKLTKLCLDHNELKYSDIVPVFSAVALRFLMLSNMNLGPPPANYFSRTPLPPLEFIDLTGSHITHLNLSVFAPLRSLHRLRAADSHIVSLSKDYVSQLQRLDLQNNALFKLPQTCRNGSSLFPNLRRLALIQNQISDISGDICLPRLTYLDLSYNPFIVFSTDMFNEVRFPKLESLYLALNPFVKTIEKFAFRSPTLKLLSLMFCSIRFSTQFIDPESFAGMPRLDTLQVSHSLGAGIPNSKFNQLFGSLTSLQILYMGNFELHSIHKETFSSLTQLRRLYLYRNRISEIPDGAFDSLINLKTLVLSYNQIQTIRESAFSFDTQERLVQVDLSQNPFSCDCDILWFQKWFLASPHLFPGWETSYACGNIPDKTLHSFVLDEQACYLRLAQYKIILTCVTVFIIILFMISVVFQYRWHIRLMLAFRGHSEIMRRRLQEEDFVYDIFVSCAEEDEHWVLGHLLTELEGRQGYRLCFHERDFRLGKTILNNIVDSVKASKKFMMVFSKHFAQSRWCQFELDLCLGHVMDNEDALIVTCLGEVASRDATSTMVAVMKTTTYIQWEERLDERASYWQRLNLSLHEIIPRTP